MFRACELKDQTYKKTRTLHFSDTFLNLRWPGDLQCEVGRFARIDSRESIRRKTYFHNVQAIRANRLKPAIRNVLVPRNAVREKGFQFGSPQALRENQAILANLRIDSSESGHLRFKHIRFFSDFCQRKVCENGGKQTPKKKRPQKLNRK